jgi:hypothetical protein
MLDMISRPRTSRFRGGNAYEERKTNNWAAFVGFLLGRGYASTAISEALGDGTSPETIRDMAKKWGLPSWGRKQDCFVVLPLTQRDRANLTSRARQHGLSIEEYSRRMLICGSMPRDRYNEIVTEDQFY